MVERTGAAAPTADREMVLTRLVDAPRELVWKAFTEPEHVAQWWGPDGFRNTIHEMDVRPGGVWRFIMHGPDGVDYLNHVEYIEVLEPERLVYVNREDVEGAPEHFTATVTFEERGGKTQVTLRAVFPTDEEYRKAVDHGAIEGGQQTLGRLAEYLKDMA